MLRNIRHKMRCKLNDESSDMLECFDFMHGDYARGLTERGRRSLGLKLRKLVADAVETRWDKFWDAKTGRSPELLSRVYDKATVTGMLRQPSVWADVYTILFAMHVLNLNILFFDQSRHAIYCGVQGERMRQQPTVFVMWVDNAHFQPILRLTCDARGRPRVKGVFRYGEDRIVDHVFRVWETNQQCHTVSLGSVLL